MGEASDHIKVKLLIGQIVSDSSLFTENKKYLESLFGPSDMESEAFTFDYTDYYRDEMGPDLKRKFLTFENLIQPERLADIKLETNNLEKELSDKTNIDFKRPVNLDPGYLGMSKLVLATTKNYSHRIYLRDGIYAEVTLQYKNGIFEPFPWTYPDYKSEDYRRFFKKARNKYRDQLKDSEII